MVIGHTIIVASHYFDGSGTKQYHAEPSLHALQSALYSLGINCLVHHSLHSNGIDVRFDRQKAQQDFEGLPVSESESMRKKSKTFPAKEKYAIRQQC